MSREPGGGLARGACWLGCGQDDTAVMWVGHLKATGPEGTFDAHLWGCPRCMERTYVMARERALHGE